MSEAVREGVPSRGPGTMSTLLFLTLTLTHTLTHTTTVTAQLFLSTTDATATGHREFIEEYRHDLQHPDYTPHTHTLTTQHTSRVPTTSWMSSLTPTRVSGVF
jgi:hypothetical protein